MIEKLKSIVVLWRQPDLLTLWGIPYDMRPGQQPYDLWKAWRDYVPPLPGWYGSKRICLDDWVYLGEPGWWGTLTREDQKLIEEFLAKHKDDIPHGPCEWSPPFRRVGMEDIDTSERCWACGCVKGQVAYSLRERERCDYCGEELAEAPEMTESEG